MAVQDYNKEKALDVDSVSGTPTIDKAQPVLVKGERFFKETDGFEDGNYTSSPQWTTGTGGNYTVQTTTVKNGSNSLECDFSSGTTSELVHDRGTGSISDGDTYTAWIQQASDQGKGSLIGLSNNDGADLLADSESVFAGIYDFYFALGINGTVVTLTDFGTVDADIWYKVELTVYPSKDAIKVVYKDSNGEELLSTTETGTFSSPLRYAKIYDEVRNRPGNNYYDDVSFSTTTVSSETGGATGTGDIVLNWDNISSESDLAVYDQNDNLLPYEIESFDATSETATLWVYDSWVRDGSTQAKVVYGNGPGTSEEGTPAEVWGNTGQNAVMVQHLQDDPLTATDSTANNNDGTVNGATSVSGEFDGAASFDGTDDDITVPDSSSLKPDSIFIVASLLTDDNSTKSRPLDKSEGANALGYNLQINNNQPNGVNFIFGDGTSTTTLVTGETLTNGTETIFASGVDGSGAELYKDGVLKDSAAGFTLSHSTRDLFIGNDAFGGGQFLPGDISELRIYSEKKSSTWTQADYDASPKAGQVFFSQQAAQDTVTEQTINVPTTTVTQTTRNPQVEGGDTTLAVSETVLTQSTPNPDVFRDKFIELPATTVTSTTQNPAVDPGLVTVDLNETQLTSTTNNPGLTIGQNISVPTTTVTSTTQNPGVTGGATSIGLQETTLTVSTIEPEFRFSQNIALPTTTVTSTTQNPVVTGGPTTITPQPSTLTVSTPNPGAQQVVPAPDLEMPLNFSPDSMWKTFKLE